MLIGHVRAGDNVPTTAIPVLHQSLAQPVSAALVPYRPDVIACNRGHTLETVARAWIRVRHDIPRCAVPVFDERLATGATDPPHAVCANSAGAQKFIACRVE